MDLRELRYFVAVAEEGHLTRAAERLRTQQPPLSRLIKTIEQHLDVQLFHRKARGVELTEAGRALFDEARAILARLEHAVQTTQRTARGEQGRLRVALPPTGPFHPFVPRVVRMFRETFPLVSVTGQPKAILSLASRRSDASVVVRHFVSTVRRAAKSLP